MKARNDTATQNLLTKKRTNISKKRFSKNYIWCLILTTWRRLKSWTINIRKDTTSEVAPDVLPEYPESKATWHPWLKAQLTLPVSSAGLKTAHCTRRQSIPNTCQILTGPYGLLQLQIPQFRTWAAEKNEADPYNSKENAVDLVLGKSRVTRLRLCHKLIRATQDCHLCFQYPWSYRSVGTRP